MANEYYGAPTTPTSDYLAHYGVKGMKWGVRKAIESGNARKLARQFRKAEKKLAKLEKLGANGKKYTKRAIGYGVGAAAAGGLAAAGTKGVSKALRSGGDVARVGLQGIGSGLGSISNAVGRVASRSGYINPKIRTGLAKSSAALKSASGAVSNAGSTVGRAGRSAGSAVGTWGKQDTLSRAMQNGIGAPGVTKHLKGVSNNTIARIGAGAIGAGLGVASARNAYRAATAKKHAQQAAAFRKEMQTAFKGTKYANQVGTTRKRKRR